MKLVHREVMVIMSIGKQKLDGLVASLEEHGENCLDNNDNPEFHKAQLGKAVLALEGILEVQKTIENLESNGLVVSNDIAHDLFRIAEPTINHEPLLAINFESFSSPEESSFNKAISEYVEKLGIFIVEKMHSLTVSFDQDEIDKVCTFSDRALDIIQKIRNNLL